MTLLIMTRMIIIIIIIIIIKRFLNLKFQFIFPYIVKIK